MDGLEVLRQLRARDRSLPVVILTARDGVHDTVAGLEGGADDYETKPFRFEELLARIRTRLGSERAPDETVPRAGAATLDLRWRRAEVDGATVDLIARKFAMAEMSSGAPAKCSAASSS